MTGERILVLGGAGLVGYQVAAAAAAELAPAEIVIVSLYRKEVREALARLRRRTRCPVRGYYGDVFGRGRCIPADQRVPGGKVRRSMADPAEREARFQDVFVDRDRAYSESALVALILEEKPDVVVDSINTATALSYQDVGTAARGLWRAATSQEPVRGDDLPTRAEKLVVSLALPQLISHVTLLHRALRQVGTRLYLKIGTTGTGGMGLNIPYTHGEDKPSAVLMTKSAVAFAHTGLLFLMARTPDSPVVKEIKPAAMIGYKEVSVHQPTGPQWELQAGRLIRRGGRPYALYQAQLHPVGETLDTTPDLASYSRVEDERGRPASLRLVCANTGENGLFTRGEFEAITYLNQMEFVTPEEIAGLALLEIRGQNTGRDVIVSLDSAVMDPTYKAGLLRAVAMDELEQLEQETGWPSIALGQLGPPQLAKYLYESYLLRKLYGTLQAALEKPDPHRPGAVLPREPKDLSADLTRYVEENESFRNLATSIGLAIIAPDGASIWRGPAVRLPVFDPDQPVVPLDLEALSTKAWIDLRPQHAAWWLQVLHQMRASRCDRSVKWSSERLDRRIYLREDLRIGEMVAWIFNNRSEFAGYRIK